MNLENCFTEITNFLDFSNEWLLIHRSGETFALRKEEIEVTCERGKILFAFLNDKGLQTWRIADYEKIKNELVLHLTRNFQKQTEKIRLVPRVPANELSDSVNLVRLEKANRIAGLLIREIEQAKLVRVALNEETGRFAHIVFEIPNRRQIAVLADVSDTAAPENLLTTAILWLAKLERRVKNPIYEIWILAEKRRAKNLRSLHALLRERWKEKVRIFEISHENIGARQTEKVFQRQTFKNLETISFENLWRAKAKELKVPANPILSRAAREIIKFAPEKIDVVFNRHGETLYFSGLPFARVRELSGEEKIWFGTQSKRQILTGANFDELKELIENLQTYRRFDSPNKRHKFYADAPESWLESILKRNINQLDANLFLSPLYNQFRAEKDKIDLLAARRDGRLVVIELKVAPDREMIFQAADYWRKIELQRRAGNLRAAKIFGDSEIADKPALVYLVAPALSYHRDFEFLAKTVSPEIEIYRFDLNENWRENLKVLKRERLPVKEFSHG